MSNAVDAEWKCAGCGVVSPGKRRQCTCATNVVSVLHDGKFISEWKIGDMLKARPSLGNENSGYLLIDCLPHETPDGIGHEGGQCDIPLIKGASYQNGQAMRWGWDGNAEHPTVTPSYQCQRCGLHVTITNGIESGRTADKKGEG